MDTQTQQELERLYGLGKSATATTNFYNQVDKYIGGISTRTLTLKLTKLVDERMVENIDHYYTLTDKGNHLKPIISAMEKVGGSMWK